MDDLTTINMSEYTRQLRLASLFRTIGTTSDEQQHSQELSKLQNDFLYSHEEITRK